MGGMQPDSLIKHKVMHNCKCWKGGEVIIRLCQLMYVFYSTFRNIAYLQIVDLYRSPWLASCAYYMYYNTVWSTFIRYNV